jgi:hypothetical protein
MARRFSLIEENNRLVYEARSGAVSDTSQVRADTEPATEAR